MTKAPHRVKVYSGLAASCLAQDDGDGLLLCYRLWTVARAIDKAGRGWVTVQDIAGVWPQSKRTIRDVLNRPAGGYFWTLVNTGRGVPASKQKVYLKSLETASLNIGANIGTAFFLSFSEACSLKRFKAACYAVTFAARPEPVIISRRKLCEKFNATRQTLRNYEKTAGVETSKNRGRMSESAYRAQMVKAWESGGSCPERTRRDVYHKGGFVYFQLPNGYTADVARAARPKRTARRVYHALSSEGANDRPHRRFERVFWHDALEAHKASQKRKTGSAYFVKTGKSYTAKRGNELIVTHIWQRYETITA